jgi:hypothetical protein
MAMLANSRKYFFLPILVSLEGWSWRQEVMSSEQMEYVV